MTYDNGAGYYFIYDMNGKVVLLPGVKVNTGANFRLVELMQQGYVMLQP